MSITALNGGPQFLFTEAVVGSREVTARGAGALMQMKKLGIAPLQQAAGET